MKLTRHVPLQLQHFEIGRRTLTAVILSCGTLLLLSFSDMLTVTTESRTAVTAQLIPPGEPIVAEFANFTPEEKPTAAKEKSKKKVYNISAVIAPAALRKQGLTDAEIDELRIVCEKYVERYARIAVIEQEKFGIPASITLAQGLLESDAGGSRLAQRNNNHFGIKCFSKKCAQGHCSNFSDDHHKDFFRRYDSVWQSYRSHSEFLRKKRYRKCFDIATVNYKGWARELSRAGYATDSKYADKLIAVIEGMDLWQLDK